MSPEPRPAPFYIAPGGSGPEARIVLLSYLFPPSQAVGALRWQKFAAHLAAAGLGIDTVTLDPAEIPSPDSSRLEELPPGTRVFGARQPSLAQDRLERAFLDVKRRLRPAAPPPPRPRPAGPGNSATRVDSYSREAILRGEVPGGRLRRAYHAWMDLRRVEAWASAAEQVGRQVLEPGRHLAVVSCGPPHPTHDGARRLARDFGLPLVIDLRDPWALVERIPVHIASPAWYRLSARAERRVVEAARLVILNTGAALEAMQRAHPGSASRMRCVMNGCDDDPAPATSRKSRFIVAYAGSIYLDRDPRPLFQAARQAVTRLGASPDSFSIEFMGNAQSFGGRTLDAIAAEEGIGEFVRVHSARPRAEALEFMAGATVLLSLPQDSEMAIPSKIFEYFQFEAWILALAEPGSATDLLLRGTGSDTVSSRNVEGIAGAMVERFRAWERGERPPVLARETRFTRRYQAGLLFQALEPLLGQARPAEVA